MKTCGVCGSATTKARHVILDSLYIQSKGMLEKSCLYARNVLDVLYDDPIISRKKILEKLDIKPTTLNVTVNSLQERGIIQETTGYSRNQVFAFQKYIDLFLK